MVLQLDPRYPLVWRSPDTIQLGVDRPLVIVARVSAALENVLAALRSGVPRSGALMLGERAGASEEDISSLITALRPALLPTSDTETDAALVVRPAAPPASTVYVDGSGPTAGRIRSFLADLGLPAPPPDREPDLAVVLGHYALFPERHAHWLRRDVPHLPVVFSDCEVRIGPLVEPGTGPCLYCLELTRVDEDPAWPAIACQLVTRTAPTETPRIALEVAARVAGLVQDRLRAGRSELTGTAFASPSLALDAETGVLRRRAHRPHARCGCRSLPGSETAPAGSAAAGPTPTSSGRAAGAPG